MTFDAVLERMAAIHQAKNADYGNSFELSAQLLGGLWWRGCCTG